MTLRSGSSNGEVGLRLLLLGLGLGVVFLGAISMPGPGAAEESSDPNPATGQTKRLIAFTEFARATAIDIEDIRSDLSAHEPATSGRFAQAVFCSIHQVYEVRPARFSLGESEPRGILDQLKPAKP
ncbi:hypothetical protein [uncultured Roseibium sp.]|uniref:hypothetical protein n=1 Tax=uncultured Roseibium sp. TaxID=1936171 RepID=UPI00260258B5|nr:hypothetical protein [uncultured Roseibium sp.]